MDLDMQHLLSEFSNEASELLGKAESEIIELEKNQDSDRINAILDTFIRLRVILECLNFLE